MSVLKQLQNCFNETRLSYSEILNKLFFVFISNNSHNCLQNTFFQALTFHITLIFSDNIDKDAHCLTLQTRSYILHILCPIYDNMI